MTKEQVAKIKNLLQPLQALRSIGAEAHDDLAALGRRSLARRLHEAMIDANEVIEQIVMTLDEGIATTDERKDNALRLVLILDETPWRGGDEVVSLYPKTREQIERALGVPHKPRAEVDMMRAGGKR